MMSGFDLLEQRVTDPGILENQVFRNFFPYTYQDIESRLGVYKSVRDQTRKLLEIIESQIND